VDAVFVNNKRIPLINNQYTFNSIDQHQRVRVTFKPITHIITATSGIYGNIDPSGEVLVDHGNDQNFTFTSKENARLAQLIVDGQELDINDSYAFNDIAQNHTIMAIFVPVFQVEASHGDNGTVTPAGKIHIDQGGYQTFSFMPDWGYEIDTVNINDQTLETRPNTYSCLNVSKNHKLHVTFKRVQWTIAAIANSGGKIAPSGNLSVKMGDDQTFTFTPEYGYQLSALIVDGLSQPLDQQSYTFETVSSDHSISVSFSAIQYHIFTTSSTGGSIYPSGVVTVNKGQDQTFTIQPSTGYALDAVLLDDAPFQIQNNRFYITSVTEDHELHANFIQLHTLSILASPNGLITPNGNIQVRHGDTQIFALTPADGYTNSTVTVDNVEMPFTNNTMILENIQADHTIAASYTPICHIITTDAGENGEIEPQGAVSVNEGHDKTFVILPDDDYEINTVFIDNEPVELTQNQYTFNNVREAHTISVTFKIANHAPVVSDMSISLFEDQVFFGNLEAVDSDGNPLTFTIIQPPQLGTIAVSEFWHPSYYLKSS
jgi:hypothetical protein